MFDVTLTYVMETIILLALGKFPVLNVIKIHFIEKGIILGHILSVTNLSSRFDSLVESYIIRNISIPFYIPSRFLRNFLFLHILYLNLFLSWSTSHASSDKPILTFLNNACSE